MTHGYGVRLWLKGTALRDLLWLHSADIQEAREQRKNVREMLTMPGRHGASAHFG